MSVVDQLKNLFAKKPPSRRVEHSGELSLGMPDASLDPMRHGRWKHAAAAARWRRPDPDSVAQDDSLDAAGGGRRGRADLGAAARAAAPSSRTSGSCSSCWRSSLVVLGSVAVFAVRAGRHGRPAGGRHRPVADAVAAPGQVGVAGPGGQRPGLPRREGKRRRAGAARCAACKPATRRCACSRCGSEFAGRRRQDRAADGARREERRHRDGPAEDPDAGGHRPAHHQPPVVRPAGNRRDGVLAEAAAERAAGRDLGRRPAGDADAAHRQVRQRIPDRWKA